MLAGVAPLDPADAALEAHRAAAAAGTDVRRIVVLVDAARGLRDDIRALLERDRAAGVRTHLVDASCALPDGDHPLAFTVCDDRVELADGVRHDAEAIAAARAFAEELLHAESLDELVLPEPIAASAPVGRALADAHCDGCGGYHGMVEDLRLLSVVAGPQRHGRFFRDGLLTARGPRVLIAGMADTSMLRHVLAAYAELGRRPTVIALDLCRTPLLQASWLAAEHGLDLEAVAADLTRYAPERPVDVIVTDSVLTLLDDAGRSRAMAAWHDALAPGGCVVTALRLGRPGDRRPDAEAFAAIVRAAAERRAGLIDHDPDDLDARTRAYFGAPIPLSPVPGPEALRDLVTGAGLVVETLDVVDKPGRVPPEAAGPGAHQPARFARLVARRP